MSILDRFSVLLLDMNGTFMFGEDRFGPGHDYVATYRSLGGQLPREQVRHVIQECHDRLDKIYPHPAFQNNFPTVKDTLCSIPDTRALSESELIRLERTFAKHDLGRYPKNML